MTLNIYIFLGNNEESQIQVHKKRVFHLNYEYKYCKKKTYMEFLSLVLNNGSLYIPETSVI